MSVICLRTLAISSAALACAAALAQDTGGSARPASGNLAGQSYPQIDANLRATFRIYSTNAQQVHLHLAGRHVMTRDENGVWTATAEPLVSEFHCQNLYETLAKAGVRDVDYESPDTAHEWLSWRRNLYQFAPLLYQD